MSSRLSRLRPRASFLPHEGRHGGKPAGGYARLEPVRAQRESWLRTRFSTVFADRLRSPHHSVHPVNPIGKSPGIFLQVALSSALQRRKIVRLRPGIMTRGSSPPQEWSCKHGRKEDARATREQLTSLEKASISAPHRDLSGLALAHVRGRLTKDGLTLEGTVGNRDPSDSRMPGFRPRAQ